MHKSGFDAIGADTDFLDMALKHRTNVLQVGIKPTFVDIMGMADIAAGHWFFSTNSALF